MILSVIIPQYKETDSVVKRLLSSINYQLNVDWNEVEVIIVNDGSDVKLSDGMLKSFDNIRWMYYIQLPKNVGPGLCRQVGIDRAKGEYVTFCDADDIYQNFGVFSLYFEKIRSSHPDIIQTQWLEEVKLKSSTEPEKYVLKYTQHDFEATWMHGKCISKKFLTDNNIRFSDKLLYHEDSYFLSNAFEIATKVEKCPSVTYVWTFDDNSITRKNSGEYSYKSIPEFIRAITYSIEWLTDKTPKKIPNKVVQLSLYIYYMLQSHKDWDKTYKDAIENEMANTIVKFKKEMGALSVASFSAIDLNERKKVGGMSFIIDETYPQWISRICNNLTLTKI